MKVKCYKCSKEKSDVVIEMLRPYKLNKYVGTIFLCNDCFIQMKKFIYGGQKDEKIN